MRKLVAILTCITVLYSCTPDSLETITGATYVPVYQSAQTVNDISVTNPQPTIEAGKIYVFGRYIFQNDINKGIHIIDNIDRSKPVKIAFLQVPFSKELAVKGNYLYTNNLDDLVVFDISSIANPTLVQRLADIFPATDQKYPPYSNVYFECPDPSKGLVVKWELTNSIKEPKCRR